MRFRELPEERGASVALGSGALMIPRQEKEL